MSNISQIYSGDFQKRKKPKKRSPTPAQKLENYMIKKINKKMLEFIDEL